MFIPKAFGAFQFAMEMDGKAFASVQDILGDGSTDNSIGWFGDCLFDSCIKYEGSEPYLVRMGSRMI